MTLAKDLTGLEFGALKALYSDESDKHGNRIWKCVCICNNYKKVLGVALTSGKTKSCGCLVNSKELKVVRNFLRLLA